MTMIEAGQVPQDPMEIDEDDELDGWGPVRVRRSSVQVCVAMSAERVARDADEESQASTESPPAGEPPHPISYKLLV